MHNSLLYLLLKNDDFLNTDISQGSVATRLGCNGVFVYNVVTNFLLSLTVKEFKKIGQYVVKLWARVKCLVFLTHSVYVCHLHVHATAVEGLFDGVATKPLSCQRFVGVFSLCLCSMQRKPIQMSQLGPLYLGNMGM